MNVNNKNYNILNVNGGDGEKGSDTLRVFEAFA